MILLVFNFDISDFVNNAQILSYYRTQSTFNNGGDQVTDNFKLTSDDEQLIRKYLKSGCSRIAQVMSGYGKNLYASDGVTELPSFEYDVELDGNYNQIVFRLGVPDNFPVHNIDSIDDAISDALENYILSRSAKLKGVEFQSFEADYENALGNIRSGIHQRNTTTIRNMNLF